MYIFAPECQHCHHFEPQFNKFLNNEGREATNLKVLKLDATKSENTKILSKYNISGLPGVLFFEAGEENRRMNPGYADNGIAESWLATAAGVSMPSDGFPAPLFAKSAEEELNDTINMGMKMIKFHSPGQFKSQTNVSHKTRNRVLLAQSGSN